MFPAAVVFDLDRTLVDSMTIVPPLPWSAAGRPLSPPNCRPAKGPPVDQHRPAVG